MTLTASHQPMDWAHHSFELNVAHMAWLMRHYETLQEAKPVETDKCLHYGVCFLAIFETLPTLSWTSRLAKLAREWKTHGWFMPTAPADTRPTARHKWGSSLTDSPARLPSDFRDQLGVPSTRKTIWSTTEFWEIIKSLRFKTGSFMWYFMLSGSLKNTLGLRRPLSQLNACCMSILAWVQIPSTHLNSLPQKHTPKHLLASQSSWIGDLQVEKETVSENIKWRVLRITPDVSC